MIIDVNAFLGHYPFRQLRITRARELVDHMDANSIDVALVSSLHAVFYRDAHRGNEELFDDIQPFSGRLLAVAAVNPRYVGWERDLEAAVVHGHAKAIALHPEHHGYELKDHLGQAALRSIAEYGLPVVLTQRLEDRRQRHHWDIAGDLSMSTVIEAATAFPSLRFLLSNWIGLKGLDLRGAGLRHRCLIDFARLHVLLNKDVPQLIEALDTDCIAFGSHMPFDYVGPSLVKLANLQALYPEDYERFAWRNAAEFLRLDVQESKP